MYSGVISSTRGLQAESQAGVPMVYNWDVLPGPAVNKLR